MIKSCNNFLKNFDFFGAPLYNYIDSKNKFRRSVLGGITSFILFATSLIYAIMVVYRWQTNQISPKIQQSSYVSDYSKLDLNYSILSFLYWNMQENTIDPFKANVLIPIVAYTKNYIISRKVVLRLTNGTLLDDEAQQYLIPNVSLSFIDFYGATFTSSEMYIIFAECQQQLLPEEEECATEEIIQQFYSQPGNQLSIEIMFKSIDSGDKQIKINWQDITIQLENQLCYTLSISLQSTTFQINDAYLFEAPSESEYVTGALIYQQTNSLNYCEMAYGHKTYAVVYVAMNGQSLKSIFEYPHISDLLANIGSIISVLFLVKYIILYLNSSSLQQSLINELLGLYYPEFPKFQIFKNWRGRIQKVSYNKQCLSLEIQQQFLSFLKKQTKKMKLKLSIVNILYEISRLYLLLRQMKSQEEIKKVHTIGIRLEFVRQNIILNSSFSERDYFQQKYMLNHDDINILSLGERVEQYRKEENIPNELNSIINDYYDANKIIIYQNH